jgi:hypothetical protein
MMAKTVNVSVVLTRDGLTTVQNFDKMGYATFVALQAAMGSVLSMLQSWGSTKVAASIEGRPTASASGDSDLRCELKADHGPGTSEASVGYTGIAAKDADEITAAFMNAVASVTGGNKKP